ncbi:hypothetical protein [Ammoniphilus resinae]|uniref:Uncharacterized protein n=1 Tax=Ammoniphilus resinae TaxID=861532 RepID=A0ABS4GJX1_9BACL|nr:hypothetical protein [Ammoniphilus resinae]MBP1930558.1 hypothetical protein [Ammoniphilus resinae]
MTSAIHAFMNQIVDYAGLFPPASLTLEPAIHNYASYLSSQDSWMIGQFILPATRLKELENYLSLFHSNFPLHCTVLGKKSEEKWAYLEVLKTDLEQIFSMTDRYGDSLKINTLELPLPAIVPDRGLLEIIRVKTGKLRLHTFCEMTLPMDDHWEQHLHEILDQIGEYHDPKGLFFGFKLRTGGVTANAFPSPFQVATALISCRDRGIPMKFTAGLHHSIRMYRDEVATQMHGFVNVFAAGMLACRHNLDVNDTAQILKDENPVHFNFTDDGLTWRDLAISVPDIERLRKTMFRSYGSCSFDEPREDLRALKIL